MHHYVYVVDGEFTVLGLLYSNGLPFSFSLLSRQTSLVMKGVEIGIPSSGFSCEFSLNIGCCTTRLKSESNAAVIPGRSMEDVIFWQMRLAGNLRKEEILVYRKVDNPRYTVLRAKNVKKLNARSLRLTM